MITGASVTSCIRIIPEQSNAIFLTAKRAHKTKPSSEDFKNKLVMDQ